MDLVEENPANLKFWQIFYTEVTTIKKPVGAAFHCAVENSLLWQTTKTTLIFFAHFFSFFLVHGRDACVGVVSNS